MEQKKVKVITREKKEMDEKLKEIGEEVKNKDQKIESL